MGGFDTQQILSLAQGPGVSWLPPMPIHELAGCLPSSSEQKQCRVPAALGVAAVCRQGQVTHHIISKLCRPGVGTGQVM